MNAPGLDSLGLWHVDNDGAIDYEFLVGENVIDPCCSYVDFRPPEFGDVHPTIFKAEVNVSRSELIPKSLVYCVEYSLIVCCRDRGCDPSSTTINVRVR